MVIRKIGFRWDGGETVGQGGRELESEEARVIRPGEDDRVPCGGDAEARLGGFGAFRGDGERAWVIGREAGITHHQAQGAEMIQAHI